MSFLNPPNRVRTHYGPGYKLFDNAWKSLDVFVNVWKSSEHLRKSRYSEDKYLMHLTHEKLAGIYMQGTFHTSHILFLTQYCEKSNANLANLNKILFERKHRWIFRDNYCSKHCKIWLWLVQDMVAAQWDIVAAQEDIIATQHSNNSKCHPHGRLSV